MSENNNIYRDLSRAKQDAETGREMPSLDKLTLMKRSIYRLVIRFIFKISRVITVKQNRFNDAVLQILQKHTEMFYDLQLRNADDTTRFDKEISSHDSRIKELERKIVCFDKNIDYLRNMQIQLSKKIEVLEQLKDRSEGEVKKQVYPKRAGSDLDALYVFLEDNLRGDRQEIKKRLKIYIPYIKKIDSEVEDFSLLDIGCGRGEWLEILSEEKIRSSGIDMNSIMVNNCRELGLEVKQQEAMEHLKDLPDRSLGAVTAFHLIEHYEFEQLVSFLQEIHRVLKPGGIVIFETPNPNNIVVASNTFYLDPTHKRPLPHMLTELIIQACGFSDTTVLKLHPVDRYYPAENAVHPGRTGVYDEYFFGPQDYSIIGHKR